MPIIASAMFATGDSGYLAGLNRPKKSDGAVCVCSFCMAHGRIPAPVAPVCRLAVVLFWEGLCKESCFQRRAGNRQLRLLCLCECGGLMAYITLRFGPLILNCVYNMTGNDMTHRSTNLERILYGIWYFLFEPMQLEGKFPYLQSASIATDYLGKLVTESWFGGIFACSMLTWGIFLLGRLKKNGVLSKELTWFCCVSLAAALVIGCVDANGAGILIRYGCDVSWHLFGGGCGSAWQRAARRKRSIACMSPG
ncbi:MAG: hypothetical protein ACLURV_04125 [Gallintestinimicrobium sp.]